MKDKDESVIPKGCYCYSADYVCPYWKIKKDRPEQYNGWCDFLKKGDLELAKDMLLEDVRTGEVIKGDELPIPVSLLWDQCKECGINEDEEDWEDQAVETGDRLWEIRLYGAVTACKAVGVHRPWRFDSSISHHKSN